MLKSGGEGSRCKHSVSIFTGIHDSALGNCYNFSHKTACFLVYTPFKDNSASFHWNLCEHSFVMPNSDQ